MSAPPTGRTPSSGSNDDALPAAPQMTFPKQLRPVRIAQRERREEEYKLWRSLDDLVTDASEFPSPREPCILSTPTPRPLPFRGMQH
jgi:hypothetical protein